MSLQSDFHTGLLRRLIYGVVAINLLVAAGMAFSLHRSLDKYRERAEITTQNLTGVLTQYIGSTIDKVDLGLLMTSEEIEREIGSGRPDADALSAFMSHLQSHLPWVIGLRATDEQGLIAYGTDVPKDNVPSMADRLYFIRHRDDPGLGLFINKPVMSRINKTWVINFARRLNRPDGSFAGVVFANISLENIARMLDIANIGDYGAINLRDGDMELIARRPAPQDLAEVIGKKDLSPQYQQLIDAGQTRATFHTPIDYDKVARIVSYRKLDNHPLFVSVALADRDYLAQWHNEVLQMSGLMLLFIVISGGGAGLIARVWRRQWAIIDHLAHEEEKFHTVADYPYDWEYWEGLDQRIEYMSPSCQRITGYTLEAFTGNPALLTQIVHPDDRELFDHHRHDVNYSRPAELDFRIVRSDGEIRWISHCCQAVYGRDGRYIGHRVSNRDITDRHLFETEINRLAQAADQNPTGILITDPQGTLTYTNMAYTRITGYAFGEAYRKPHRELIASEMTVTEFDECQRQIKTGKIWNRVLRNRHKNTEMRWEQIIASPIYDNTFSICNYLYLRTDITELKTTQDQLQLLSYALDRVGESILLMGENDPHFLYANQSAAQNLGYSREELTGGMSVYDIDPTWTPTMWADFWPQLSARRRMQLESLHRNRDGQQWPVEITANYFEYDGKIYNLVICRNISERKQAENELHRLNRELQAISNCNQTLLRTDDEPTLLEEICRIICDEAGYRMAWVGYAEHDADKTVRPVVWAGAEDGYLGKITVSWADDTPFGQGPAGIAIRSGKMLYIQDIATDPLMAPWRDNALQHGYRSGIALPLKDDKGDVFGSLLIYSAEANAITPAEIRLLEELASDLAFGIIVLRTRSERRRIEAMLHDSEERLRMTLEATQIGVWDWDVQNDRWYASPTYYTMLGYPPQEGMADRHQWLERVHPDDYNRVSKKIQDVLTRDCSDYQYEARLRHADGSYRWQQVRGFGIRRDHDGKVSRMLGIRLDIHERMLMEEALRESEATYRRIVDTASEGIWVLGTDAMTTFVNARMADMLGYSCEDMLGRPVTDFMFEDDLADHLQKMTNHRQGITENYERRFKCKNGKILWILASATPIFDDEHRFKGSLAMMTDITDRKHNEEELHRYKDHLEEEIQQRTTDLVQARNAAEAANQAKSVFLANMSHELRTPLNAILGFSTLMRNEPNLPTHQRQNLDIINRSGEHLLSLINDVLEMAKIEAGRIQLENAPFDLGGMVRDVTDMMNVRAREKGLRLLIDQSSEFPRFIVGDEARLRQVLINLVGNAIKFTHQGEVILRLSTKQNRIAHLLIEVEDTGPGIADEDQPRIFQPFVQLGSQGDNKGTGLGLTITRQFIQLMGGNLSLQSTLGKGSLFIIDLPLSEASEADIEQHHPAEAGEVFGLAAGQPEYRILIVEDQLENRLLLAKLMTSAGFSTQIAENGEQAIALFQSWQPHFIWMDRQMPVMDGLEAMKKIRQLPGGKDVKIVAVTASAFKEQRAELLEQGMDDFVRKPYRFNEIYDCLARQLGVRYVYQDTTEPAPEPVTLTADMLADLPEALRNDLKDALESLESERIEQIIETIASYDPALSQTLSHFAENFDYPTILGVLQAHS